MIVSGLRSPGGARKPPRFKRPPSLLRAQTTRRSIVHFDSRRSRNLKASGAFSNSRISFRLGIATALSTGRRPNLRNQEIARLMRKVMCKINWSDKMFDIHSYIDDFQKVLGIISDTYYPSIFILVGLFLLLLSSLYIYKSIRLDARDTPLWYKSIIFFSLALGVIFLASGAAAAMLHVFDNPIRRVSKDEAIQNLGANKKTEWLIRLIPYKPSTEPYLSIDNITKLGPPKLQYVFVAPYSELRGYKVSDAVQMVGGTIESGADQRVTAIIFRTKHIYPANARGVVQLLRKMERTKLSDSDTHIANLSMFDEVGHEAEHQDIDQDQNIHTWAWGNYRKFFPKYCEIAQAFKCNKGYSAHQYISEFNDDWSPFGYARNDKLDTCKIENNPCLVDSQATSWDSIANNIENDFGARSFFIDNYEIKDLGSRYLIDFDKPDQQIIPDIGPLK